MRILLLDVDTLRPDHLGCYGYARNTSPNIDVVARDGVRFTHYHCSDAPCLPSRAALTTGMLGIHNGAVGHGGTAGDVKLFGRERGFGDEILTHSLFNIFRKAGYHTASISPFAERHSSFWFLSGLNEMYNTGKCGMESAEDVMPIVEDWLLRNGEKDNWALHINLWDAHTPYRAPEGFGNPFAGQPYPDWITEAEFEKHLAHIGPHGAREINMYDDSEDSRFPRHPGALTKREELRRLFDGYDCGIAYLDQAIGRVIGFLKDTGLYDDTAILITSDHGEDMGELGLYAEHALTDELTTSIPMIIKWPGIAPHVDEGLHYNIDLLPTLCDLLGVEKYPRWDGASYSRALTEQQDCGREYLVLSQCAHVCQRSVRWKNWLYMVTYHGGLHLFDEEMLFDITADPHETKNLMDDHPEVAGECARILQRWHAEMMAGNEDGVDPLQTVIKEGGPFHSKGQVERYVRRLRETGRGAGAEEVLKRYPVEKNSYRREPEA